MKFTSCAYSRPFPRFNTGRQRGETLRIACLTLPNYQGRPSSGGQLDQVAGVTYHVPIQLPIPIVRPRLRPGCRFAAGMLMPEAPMHEQRHAAAWKHQVRNARKVPIMEPEAQASGVEKAPHDHFRGGVAGTHSPHSVAALLRRLAHWRNSIFRLGSVSTSSTISL